jgi:cytochrome P450
VTHQLVLDRFEDIKAALSHPDLSRGIDTRSYEEGNPRAGILSMLHGAEHRARRHLTNPLFHRRNLVTYERALFPDVLQRVLEDRAHGQADLFRLAGELSVVLAARRAGIDHDGSAKQLGELWRDVLILAQAAAALDIVGDVGTVQAEARATLAELDARYVTPSLARRAALIGAGEEPPFDLLTVALRAQRAGEGMDHGLIVREAGLYLHGGSHTSAQTVCNTFALLLGAQGGEPRPDLLARAGRDLTFAQRCVHETLRLRPTTPRIKRVAVDDAEVAGQAVPAGALVVLDVARANRDPGLFGDGADRYDPDRAPAADVPLWGLSFGAGAHTCIGRSVAGGFPVHGPPADPHPAHLHGLVAAEVHAIAARTPSLDPADPPELDRRTDRGTRWYRFPVVFQEG